MMSTKHFAALLGFAFVAAWIGFNFGLALLCLLGAGVFYFVASYLEGEVDLGELQARFSPQGGVGQAPPARPVRATPRVR